MERKKQALFSGKEDGACVIFWEGKWAFGQKEEIMKIVLEFLKLYIYQESMECYTFCVK